MTIKRIASLLALSAAIAAVPAAAPSTFASISPTAAFAHDCYIDGAPVPCGGGGDGGGDGNDDVHPGPCNGHFIGASARVCDFPIAPGTDVPPAFARPTSTVPIKIRSPGK